MGKLIAAGLALTLSGCATYTYTKTPDGCQVTINSGRDIEAGQLSIGKNCEVNAGAEGLTGAEARALLKAILSP